MSAGDPLVATRYTFQISEEAGSEHWPAGKHTIYVRQGDYALLLAGKSVDMFVHLLGECWKLDVQPLEEN